MGKFKVGDRVRRVTRSDWPSQYGEVGNEYTVLEVPSEHLIVVVDGCSGAMAHAFELVAPTITIEPGKHYRLRSGKVTGRVAQGDIGFEATVDGSTRVFDNAGGAVFGGGDDIVEAWVPKVGERVRFVRGSTAGGARYGYEGETATVVADGPTGVEKPFTTVKLDGGETRIHFNPSAYLSDLEPLLVAAPAQPAASDGKLTIQAGRYYKTRDGRKVGPMTRDTEGHLYGQVVNDRGRSFHKEGGAHIFDRNLDLIAEWVDATTTSNVGAQVDTLAEEYGPVAVAAAPVTAASNDNAEPAKTTKFKVGDSVRLACWLPGYYEVTKIEGENFWIKAIAGPDLQYRIDFGDWIVRHAEPAPTVAIVALIENGVGKPSSKPKVHDDQAAATAEAERLALEYPGQQFGVFVLAASKIADVVNVPTAVLRAA